ncbi:hypothetical protein FACS189413_15740 [Bacteroidia bacterium]|nr:hypothetical protein FACS189413_15740 [Bacteroidia bacterium]
MIKRKYILTVLLVWAASAVVAQSLRLEDLKDNFGKGKAVKLNGGASLNTVYDAGNDMMGRDPFAYYLNGNLNLNIYGLVDLPFSFSITNSGNSYKLPSSPNRLSLHPSYKWITAHIGDVSMTFSPYTLSGHIFTGAGVELTPGGWEFAALYGRFLKAVEYDSLQAAILPNYKRVGYGVKAGRSAEKYQVSINLFNAKDEVNSLLVPPDSLGIMPMENLAGGVTFMYRPVQIIKISGEYGLSLLTNDRRSPANDRNGLLGAWAGGNQSSSAYNAFKAKVDLVGKSNSIGLGYERIDPGYKTLGAYYFVNDIENITVNAAQSFWKEKMNLSMSIGYERDDLDKKKANFSSRIVGSINLSAKINERINANLSYSNFQNYTNVRSNFELINQENQFDLLDTLNFVQLSQNANLNVGIVTKKTEKQEHSLNMNFSWQDAAGKQGDTYQAGSLSEMINASAAYTCNFLESGLSLSGNMNLNNSKLSTGNALTLGPTIEISSKLWKKKINLRGSLSYNTGLLEGIKQNEVFLGRISSSYSPFKKHSIIFAYNLQWRTSVNRPDTNHSLITAGYSYNF